MSKLIKYLLLANLSEIARKNRAIPAYNGHPLYIYVIKKISHKNSFT